MFGVNEFTETIHKHWHIKGLLISVSHVQFSVKGNLCFDLNTYINNNCKSEAEFCFPILDVLQLKQEKWGGIFVDINRDASITSGSIIKVTVEESPEPIVMILAD